MSMSGKYMCIQLKKMQSKSFYKYIEFIYVAFKSLANYP